MNTQEELQRFKRDIDYYHNRREILLEQHPEAWIAVFNQRVVGVAPELEKLISLLVDKGVPPERALVKHLTRHEEVLILQL